MRGVRSFGSRWWSVVIFTGGVLGILRADELTLVDDARLTGTVCSINEAGVVELATALSPESVFFKTGAVTKVEFSTPEVRTEPAAALVELVNGDLLSATVESLEADDLNVVTADIGRLIIPRAVLKSLRLGVRKPRVIYSGPRDSEEWAGNPEEPKNWRFAKNALTANGPAYASKNFEAPQQFILKFTLKWQANPSFKICFADPLTPNIALVDRYYLQFNAAGLEIKRESSKGQRFQTVILSARAPDQYPANQVDVEIRVDRKASRLQLFLNGEAEGAGLDPVPAAPVGNGVALVNHSPAGTTQEIRGVQILGFDDARLGHRAVERGDPRTDGLVSRDEDRWSGRLVGIRKGPEGKVFSFRSDSQEGLLELAETDVSTILFAKSEQEPGLGQVRQLRLRLRDGGSLHVSGCTFTEDGVTARHPLLGPLKIRRSGVSVMELLESKPEAKSKK